MTFLEEVADKGTPVNRLLSFRFPARPEGLGRTDQLIFGSRYMIYRSIYDLYDLYDSRGLPPGRARSLRVFSRCAQSWRRWAPAAGNGTDNGLSYPPGTTQTVLVPFDKLAMFECMV